MGNFWSDLGAWILNFLNQILGDFLANLFTWIPTTWVK
jgi:hypothetical protein